MAIAPERSSSDQVVATDMTKGAANSASGDRIALDRRNLW
jgi:hypothetical protein